MKMELLTTCASTPQIRPQDKKRAQSIKLYSRFRLFLGVPYTSDPPLSRID
ncbi:MAG TPA: hypothetical protein PKN04_12035 [bacterium]|nr:hypothetical protein [bacterium]HNT66501.1 hypothetical protein [bacterium]HOX85576.1 hypothetical protein [bacterium]